MGFISRRNTAIIVFTASLVLIGTVAAAVAAGDDDSPTTSILGTEIPRDRISIPEDWGAPNTKTLKVQVAYDDEEIVFKSQFPADKPGIHHVYMVFENGEWVHHGSSAVGSVDDRL